MWEEILKASYSSKYFKELKGAVLRQIEELEIGKTYTLDELQPAFLNYYTPITNARGAFSRWWEFKGRAWYIATFGAIAKRTDMVEKTIIKVGGRALTSYTRIDPNAEQE